MLTSPAIDAIREAFLAAGYTTEGVPAQLGPMASAALARHETVPARHATAEATPLCTLIRLFLLQLGVPTAAAQQALPLAVAEAAGLVRRQGDEVVAALDVRPYGDPAQPWWVVSDLGTGLDGNHEPLPEDHVIGVGGASATLAQLTVRPRVARALDLGTGSGVQALHLAQHAGQVWATDVSPRALALARLTAQLSDVEIELREGPLYEPTEAERFDLIVSNPPFVVTARGQAGRYSYRDSGLPLDEVSRRLVAGAPGHLREGGWCQLLANWVHLGGQDWAERVEGWIAPTGLSGWAVQREVLDPAEYVATWLRDAGELQGERGVRRYDEWLTALVEAGVEGVGFGWIALHDNGTRTVRVEDWPHPVEQPLGPHILGWFERDSWLAAHPGDALLKTRLLASASMRQEQVGLPGAEHPERLVLRAEHGMRRVEVVDTVTAGLVGACDGTLSVGQILDAITTLLNGEAEGVRLSVIPRLRTLIAEGLLIPATQV